MENISTSRLIIRRFAEDDVADYLAYQTLPAVREFLPDEAMTPVAALSFCAKQAALEDEDRDCYHAFAVYHVGDARMIGDVGFYCPSEPENQADLGFQFHPDYHGQGLAT
ncbi:N-acetyltransferase, partial [bacterium]